MATFTCTEPTGLNSSPARRSWSLDGDLCNVESELRVAYKSRLHEMTQTTPTMLWNDSADIDELEYAIANGAVGATCNPVIAVTILKKEIAIWRPRIHALLSELPGATEDQIGWKLVEEMSIRTPKLLEPPFAEHGGRKDRLLILADPRFFLASPSSLRRS